MILKNNILAYFSLMMVHQAVGMQTVQHKESPAKPAKTKFAGMQITQPYTPPFAARHARAINITKSTLVAGTVSGLVYVCAHGMGDDNSDVLKKPLVLGFLGATAFATSYVYNKLYNSPQTIDSLLTNPQESLSNNDSMAYAFVQRLAREEVSEETDSAIIQDKFGTLLQILQKYEEKNPIFLLRECQDVSGGCILTRYLNPSYRKTFEERVSQNLIKLMSSRKVDQKLITYTSFGSGQAFQDMVVLSKALAQVPDACLDIHLIDDRNKHMLCYRYKHMLCYSDISRKIDASHISLNFVKNNFEENCKSFILQSMYRQFIAFLTQTFPQANCSLFVHESTDSYLNYLKEKNLSHADIVVAADIQDQDSLELDGCENFLQLCMKTLEKKPTASNIFLARGNCCCDEDEVFLHSYFLSEPNVENAVEIGDTFMRVQSEEI